jgi:anti-sigma factor RsiW
MESCAHVQRALSAFIDGELPPKERAALREHLSGCDTCRRVHADLLRLRGAARSLGPIAPPDHVWLEVAGRIRLQDEPVAAAPAVTPSPVAARESRRLRPRRALTQWIGLAAALLLITAGLYWLQQTPAGTPPEAAGTQATVGSVNDELNLALKHSLQAISELEKMTAADGALIDPELAATIRRQLALTDEAIAESRTALNTNPDSESARASLFDALRRKINTLQTTVSLINEMRQGDQEGAARVAEGAGKKS